jgi:hypothetical protein
MCAFLLVLGGVISAAGLAVVASGVSVQQHTFDTSNITPGTIAVIGGCILIGLGLVVRALLRVERALTVRPMPRPARPGEAASAVTPTERASEPAHIPFLPKPKPAPHPQPAPIAAAAPSPPAEDAAVQRLREKFPALPRLENAPVVEETDVSLLPKAPTRPDEDVGEVDNGSVSGRTNGTAPVRIAPQVEVNGRPSQRPERAKSSLFDSLWPKAQRPTSDAHRGPAAQAAPPPPPQSAERGAPSPNVQPAAAQQAAPAPVSVLKSGVVEGMAYTLYSDGSIEAQLPQGTLRFGSITELRNHIEQNS